MVALIHPKVALLTVVTYLTLIGSSVATVSLSSLAPGQAVKCSPSAPEVYSYMSNSIRHYPSPEIASSWDPNWVYAVVINCTGLINGPDMVMNTQLLGQAVRCYLYEPRISRLVVGGIYRPYPNETIAESWDPLFGNAMVVNCTNLLLGDDMGMNTLPIGQAIKCSDSPLDQAVYRYTARGVYRVYPNPTIASSWDPNWAENVVRVDCSPLVKGVAIGSNTLILGQAIKCLQSSTAIHRYVGGGVYRLYPNETIAKSWDPNWNQPIVPDCSVLAKGEDMPLKDTHINPDRGFSHHSETFTSNFIPLDVSALRNVSLVRRLYYLDTYKNKLPDNDLLNKLATDISTLESAGKRAILRFAFVKDDAADPMRGFVSLFVSQLRITLNQISRSLLTIEAGFIGKWGEWFFSDTFGTGTTNITAAQKESRYSVANQMALGVTGEVSVAVRSTYWRELLLSFNATLASRLTLYDDCIFAKESDLGTFSNNDESVHSYPFGGGGEVCSDSYDLDTTNDCSALLKALDRINATYLNLDYDKSKLAQYENCNYADRVGYAIESRAKSVRCTGLLCTVSFGLANTGFARPSRAKSLTLQCGSESTTLDGNFRDLFPGTTRRFSATLDVPSCASPLLYVRVLEFPSDPRYSVKLTNAQSFDIATGANVVV